jgi:hypothetical protein
LDQAHTRLRVRYSRKGLEGREAVAPHSGVTEPPQSPVFGVAENAPKCSFENSSYLLIIREFFASSRTASPIPHIFYQYVLKPTKM